MLDETQCHQLCFTVIAGTALRCMLLLEGQNTGHKSRKNVSSETMARIHPMGRFSGVCITDSMLCYTTLSCRDSLMSSKHFGMRNGRCASRTSLPGSASLIYRRGGEHLLHAVIIRRVAQYYTPSLPRSVPSCTRSVGSGGLASRARVLCRSLQ